MDFLSLRNAIFYPDKIVLIKKKGKIIIEMAAIDCIKYKRPTLLNYILASVWFGGTFPGRLEINLKDNMFTRKAYHTSLFVVKIKYKDYINLPQTYHQKLVS